MSGQKGAQKSRRNTDKDLLNEKELNEVHGGVGDGSQGLAEAMESYTNPQFQGPVKELPVLEQPSGEGMAGREQGPIALTPLQQPSR